MASTYLQRYRNLAVLKSISKSHGVPGLRLAVLAAGDLEFMQAVKRALPPWNINSLAEYFLQIISPFQAQYRQACGQIRAERARFRQELSAISFLEVFPSQANFILCRVSAKYTATSLARLLLSRHGMLIKDLTGKEGFEEGHFIQMAVRSEADNRRLTNALRSLE